MNPWSKIGTWLSQCFTPNRSDLQQTFASWESRRLISRDEHDLLLSVTSFAQLQVRDVMVPRSHVIALRQNETCQQLIEIIATQHHSRYPVFDESFEEVLGVVLAKDILMHTTEPDTPIASLMRRPTFVPEAQRLDTLLRSFKLSHNHMAIVIDEFGTASGLITIEDVLEQIVGDIVDEHDEWGTDDMIHEHEGQTYVMGLLSIDEFNAHFGTNIDNSYFDTISGVVAQAFGYIPEAGESISINNVQFKVQNADKKRIIRLSVQLIHA